MATSILMRRGVPFASLEFIGNDGAVATTTGIFQVDTNGDITFTPRTSGSAYITGLKLGGLSINRLMVADANGISSSLAAPGSDDMILVGDQTGQPTWTSASSVRTILGLVPGTDVQVYDADLTAIAGLSGTAGLLYTDGVGGWNVDNTSYTPQTRNLSINGIQYDLSTDRSWNISADSKLNFLFSGTNSDIVGYESASIITSFTPGVVTSVSQSVTTTPTLLASFATPSGFPNTNVLTAGIAVSHFETTKNNGGHGYYVYFEIYKRTIGGIETLITTSDNSSVVTSNTSQQWTLGAEILSNTFIDSTDRIVIKVYAVMASGTNTITLYYDDNTNSGFNIGVASPDINIYVPYSGAINNLNLGVYSLTSTGITDSSLTASKPVFTDSNKKLTNTGTIPVNQGGTNLTAYTTGDLIYASGATVISKLAIGTDGQILKIQSGLPSWVNDFSTTVTGLTYTPNTGVLSLTASYVIPTTTQETNWNTAYSNRISTFSTTGNSGAATFTSNTLNIPNYTLSGLGGVPTSRQLTINGTAYDLSADRSWTINSMVYPSTGIAVSTGTAWGTSITDNSANWNTAFGWGNHSGLYLPIGGGTLTGSLLFSGGFSIDVVATGGTDTLSIGGSNADVVNIGRSGATVNILGSTVNWQATNSYVNDVLITLNKGGGTATAVGAGIEFEENSIITGYIKTNSGRDGYLLRAPGVSYYGELLFSSLGANRTYTLPNASGTVALTSDLSAYQPLDTDLTNIAALSGTSGFLKTNGSGTWTVDTNTYLTANQTITLSGDISGSGTTAITTAIGTNKVTDAMLRQSSGLSIIGRSANTTGNVADITAATDFNILRRSGTSIGFGSIDLSQSGAVGTSKLGSSNGGTGLDTSASSGYTKVTTGTWSVISAATLKSDLSLNNVENTALSTWAGTSNITTLGTISTGVWNGTKITEAYGGTNQNTYALGDTLYSSATNTLSKLAGNTTTTKKFLTQTGTGVVSAAPGWNTIAYDDLGSGYTSGTMYLSYNGSSLAWASVSGTVSSVSAGTGMSFTTITTTGSVAIDTTKVPYYSGGFSTGLAKWTGAAWTFDSSTYLTANQTITLSGDISGSGTTAITTAIGTNKVTDAMLRQSSGLSIIGRSANTTGNVADITAATDFNILRRSGTSIGFGSIDLSQSGAVGTSILAAGNGGTGNAFFSVSGPATAVKTFTFPNASATVLTTNAAVTVGQGGTGLTTVAAGSVLAYNTLDTASAITSTSGLRVLQNNVGTISWITTTGTGDSVYGTSPTFTTSVIGGATFSVFNTASTNISAFGATTTLTIGGTPTTAITHNYSTNATATGTTKTVNLATAGAAGSTTNVNIGSAVASAILGTLTLGFPTIVQGSNHTSLALVNTQTTTLTFAGATTTLTIGGTPTTAITHNYSTNATATGTTKTVNLATAGAAGSTTNVNIGSAVASAVLGTLTLGFPTIAQSSNYTSLALFNTQTTSISAFGVATSIDLGNTATAAQTVNMFTASTGASTYNFATGATLTATTKTINIGTAGVSASVTNINVGSAVSGATGTLLLNSSVVNIPLLTASKVIFTDGSKNITSNGTVGAIQGGTGLDTSASSGYAKVTTGTWSIISAATLKSDLSLNLVENTALSTWAGTTNITTLGTITTGTWSASAIVETKGGTNQTTYTLGDTLYSSATNTLSKLAGNTTTTKKFLTQTGTGTVSAAPGWNTIAYDDLGTGYTSGTMYLSYNGAGLAWGSVSVSPAGSNTQIQFNDSGTFGADTDLTWDKTNNVLSIAATPSLTTGIKFGTSWALRNDTSFNVAIGNNSSFSAATTPSYNVFIGKNVGTGVTGGYTNIGIGHNSGGTTLGGLTSGFQNIAIGSPAGTGITTGSNNFSMGGFSHGALGAGSNNYAIGYFSQNLYTRYGSISMGSYAMEKFVGNDSSDDNNVMIGYHSGRNVVNGTHVLIGSNTARDMTGATSTGTVALGSAAGYGLRTAIQVIAIGQNAIGYYYGNGTSITGTIAIGYYAGGGVNSSEYSIIMGYEAAYKNLGSGANDGQISGDYLTLMGYYVMRDAITSANDTIAIGREAMRTAGTLAAGSLTGTDNIAFGHSAMLSISGTAANNIAIGGDSLRTATTGASNNVSIGHQAGYGLTTGASNVFLGYQAGYSDTTGSNVLVIANSSSASNELLRGSFSTGIISIKAGAGIGIAHGSVTAQLHFAAGSATANTAPIQFTNGTKETTARAGVIEYASNLHFTNNALIRYTIGGGIFDHFADAGTPASVTETDLYSDTLAVDTFAVNGDSIEASYGVTLANNAQTKQLKVKFAGTTIYDSTALTTTAAGSLTVVVKLIRVSSTVVRYMVTVESQAVSTAFDKSAVGELTGLTLSATNILKITGQSGGGSPVANDVKAIMAKLILNPAA